MKIFLTCFFGLFPINRIKILLLNIIGHKIDYSAKIGFSILLVNKLVIEKGASIGNFNLIKIEMVNLKDYSFIKKLNLIKGPFDIILQTKAGISNQNKIRRAAYPVTYGNVHLILGDNSFIVSNHILDLTRSVTIGTNSIIAGIRSQIWTHGYYHADTGSKRIRIDGEVKIGDNVYVGSGCIFNPGVKVGNSIHIGAGSVISKNLTEKGMYVNQALRFIDNNMNKVKDKLTKVNEDFLMETVYTKGE